MNKINLNLIIVFLCIGITAQAQSTKVTPVERRINVSATCEPFGNVMALLMQNPNVRIGFEESLQDQEHNDLDFDVSLPTIATQSLPDAFGKASVTVEARRYFSSKTKSFSLTLRESDVKMAMDILVSQMGDYSWEESLEVINIFPKNHRDPRINELMLLRIKKFNVTKDLALRDLAKKLTELPEVKEFLAKNELYWRSSQIGSTIRLDAQYGRPLGKDLAFHDLTFREILNMLTVAKGGGWKVRKSHLFGSKTKEFIEIDI